MVTAFLAVAIGVPCCDVTLAADSVWVLRLPCSLCQPLGQFQLEICPAGALEHTILLLLTPARLTISCDPACIRHRNVLHLKHSALCTASEVLAGRIMSLTVAALTAKLRALERLSCMCCILQIPLSFTELVLLKLECLIYDCS